MESNIKWQEKLFCKIKHWNFLFISWCSLCLKLICGDIKAPFHSGQHWFHWWLMIVLPIDIDIVFGGNILNFKCWIHHRGICDLVNGISQASMFSYQMRTTLLLVCSNCEWGNRYMYGLTHSPTESRHSTDPFPLI